MFSTIDPHTPTLHTRTVRQHQLATEKEQARQSVENSHKTVTGCS